MEAFVCSWEGCGKQYANKDTLRKHQRQKEHESDCMSIVAKLRCAFIGCEKRFPRMTALCSHIRNEHDAAEAVIEQASFENFEQFTEWKNELEKTTHCSYVQHEAAKRRNCAKHLYFYCHRSGQSSKVTLESHKRQRAIKSQGLCKLEATCTAHMAVAVDANTKKVTVSFCQFHTGHSMELGHLRLSKSARMEVAAMLQQGDTITKIMDTMRDRLGQTLERDNRICRKDIHNVKAKYNVGCIQKSGDDHTYNRHTSVDIWVQELNDMVNDSPVLLYKPQGASADNETLGLGTADFILCLPLPQRTTMVEFGNGNIVCLDSTHGSTGEVQTTDAGNKDEVVMPPTDVGPMELDMPPAAVSLDETDDNVDTIQKMQQRFRSECQQLIALGSSCNSTEAMACAIRHLKTANASLCAVATLPSQTLVQKMPANRKLDKQLRFLSAKAKRKTSIQRPTKPCTETVPAVKQILLHGSTSDTTRSTSVVAEAPQ